MIQSITRTVAVSVCSVVLTTLAVNAIDMHAVPELTMLADVFSVRDMADGPCAEGMVLVSQALVPFCIDQYEASPSEDCMYAGPASSDETSINLSNPTCSADSRSGKKPWVHVSQVAAQQACSRAGKRLPTTAEWYRAALGTPDTDTGWTQDTCNVGRNVEDGIAHTGEAMRCVSDAGAYDMVGNVWEWVEDQVDHGTWEGRQLPKSGFVASADKDGMAYETEAGAQDAFAHDRLWSDASGVFAVMRGGYYDGKGNSGVHSVYAASPPTFSGEAVGFRCAVTPSRGSMN